MSKYTLYKSNQQNWIDKQISDLGKITQGGTPSTTISSYWGNDIVWITPVDMRNNGKYSNSSEKMITKLGSNKSSAKIIKKDSIVMSTRAPIGYLSIATTDFSTNQGCKSLTLNSNYNTEFIYYLLKHNMSFLERLGTGTTFKELSKKALSSFFLKTPSTLQEQNNIADILRAQEELILSKKELLKLKKKQRKYLNQELLSGRIRLRFTQDSIDYCLTNGLIISKNIEVEVNGEKQTFDTYEIIEDKKQDFQDWLNDGFESKIEFYNNVNWKSEKVNGRDVEIPVEWSVDLIVNHMKYEKGISISEKDLNPFGNGNKYLKTTELWLDSSSKRDTMYFDGQIDNKYLKTKEDYVFSLDGFNTEVGKGTLGFMSNEGEGIVSTGWYKVLNNQKSYLMVNVWNNHHISKYIVNSGAGTTVKHAGKFLKTYEFNKPTELEMVLMNVIFKDLMIKEDSIKDEIKIEEQKFTFLKQELLSGRIRVK